MTRNNRKLVTFMLLLLFNSISAQEVWTEHFLIPDKGVWGNVSGSKESDLSEITTWTLDFSNAFPVDSEDYAKTVSTSGGRFECRDIDGEVIWKSELIDISSFEKVDIRLEANETGSGANEETKQLKAFYKINSGDEILFETNGENLGNWGSVLAEQKEIAGNTLQIIVRIVNFYATDKVILDEIQVFAQEKEYPSASPGDLVINEVLFNPFSDATDFVEIYNKSDKEFQLKNLFLASRDKDMELTQIYSLAGINYLISPKSYLVLTVDTNGVFPYYSIQCNDCFQQVAKMPSYNNDEDDVVLLNENREIIDELNYYEDLHHPLLKDVEGISLERININKPTNDPNNWHSASTEAGYATPGYENSQVVQKNIHVPAVTFNPESFSPNSDGYNDDYRIEIQTEKPGYVINSWIFDASGRTIFQLAQNEILGTSDELIWDGNDETGQRQLLGVYVVLVELFDLDGRVYRFKDGVVLTDRLE
ncbi:MAG: lamin tail domain-containing protein [Prolixibacteraceae bacterium]|nr:lamin tail domain-containing protein [Prolixibacteraceae bacterium]